MTRGPHSQGPPAAAVRILNARLSPEVRDFLMGDLEERFRELAGARSLRRARLWYWRQAVAVLLTPKGELGSGLSEAGLTLDVIQAVRALRRQPLHSLVAIAALALGLGVVGTAVSILYGTVLTGLPFDEAHRLVHFERSNPVEDQLSLAVTPHDFVAWRQEQRTFEDLGAYVEALALLPNVDAPPDRYLGVYISANSFSLLRVDAALGRLFTPDDEVPGAPDVALLSHSLWTARFGADPSLVGREIQLNGRPTTVVGVMPERFGFPIAEEFWMPLRLDFTDIERGSGRLDVFGRLRPGVSQGEAELDFLRIARGLEAAFPDTNANVRAVLRSFQEEYVGLEFMFTVLKMLAGAVIVLLISCANVANLLLVRGARRTRELAVRVALGAGRGRIVRQLLAESMVLSVVGGLMGLGIAQLGVSWFNQAGSQAGVFALPHGSDSLFWWDVGLDPVTLLVIAAITGLSAVLAGLAPALRVSNNGFGAVLREQGRGAAGSRPGRFAGGLVVGQVALTTGLAVAAGFVVLSSVKVAAADDGFDGGGVLTTRVDLPLESMGMSEAGYPDHESRIRFAQLLTAGLEGLPEVSAAAVSTVLPLERPRSVPFTVDDTEAGGGEFPEVGVATISPSYFDVFGVTPSEGRALGPQDGSGSEPVAVVNEAFAGRYLAGRSPVGARLRLGAAEDGEPWLRVVGVVPDLWEFPTDRAREAGVYLPLSQSGVTDPAVRMGWWGLRYQTVAVRARPGAQVQAVDLRDAVFRLDGTLPVREVRFMDDVVGQRMGRYRVWGRFYVAFALAGLLLAGLGVYAVLAFDVAARTPEIGVRRALGASSSFVQWEIIQTALKRIALGAAIGLAVGNVLSEGMARVLYGVDTDNPVVFLGVVGVLGLLGIAASWIPARRASLVDPVTAMREG